MKNLSAIIILCFLFMYQSAYGAGIVSTETDTTKHRNQFRHAINTCPVAPVFGILSVNYEYLFAQKHGIVARVDYENIPKRFDQGSIPDTYPGAELQANGIGYIINYRYHISGDMNSLYLGAYGRYRSFKGSGIVESTEFSFAVPEWTVGVNAGKRWVFKSGFNISIGFGWGISRESWNVDQSNPAVDDIVESFKNKYDFFTPFYGEGSIGYAF